MFLFVGSYLVVWALTGITILIGWSIPMNYIFAESVKSNTQNPFDIIFGVLLLISWSVSVQSAKIQMSWIL